MVNPDKTQSKRVAGLMSSEFPHLWKNLKQCAMLMGIFCQLAATWPAHAGTGATVSGIPTTPYSQPSDSSTGVTRATSANKGMTCSLGYVLSGSSCVAVAALVPVQSCPYGQTWSGNACVEISSFYPTPPKTCPSGQYLSGGLCLAVPVVCPTGEVLSGGVCKLWANGGGSPCSSQPSYIQYLPCPNSQGLITQTNSGTLCDASTAYTWAMSGWVTTGNTCL